MQYNDNPRCTITRSSKKLAWKQAVLPSVLETQDPLSENVSNLQVDEKK